MPLAIDFGTCNTVIARWNEALNDVEVPSVTELTKTFTYRLPGADRVAEAKVIPSLIHYGRDTDAGGQSG